MSASSRSFSQTFFRTSTVARRLKCSPRMVRYLVMIGELPAYRRTGVRAWRFDPAEVDQLAKKRMQKERTADGGDMLRSQPSALPNAQESAL